MTTIFRKTGGDSPIGFFAAGDEAFVETGGNLASSCSRVQGDMNKVLDLVICKPTGGPRGMQAPGPRLEPQEGSQRDERARRFGAK